MPRWQQTGAVHETVVHNSNVQYRLSECKLCSQGLQKTVNAERLGNSFLQRLPETSTKLYNTLTKYKNRRSHRETMLYSVVFRYVSEVTEKLRYTSLYSYMSHKSQRNHAILRSIKIYMSQKSQRNHAILHCIQICLTSHRGTTLYSVVFRYVSEVTEKPRYTSQYSDMSQKSQRNHAILHCIQICLRGHRKTTLYFIVFRYVSEVTEKPRYTP